MDSKQDMGPVRPLRMLANAHAAIMAPSPTQQHALVPSCPPNFLVALHDMEHQPPRTASSFDLEAADVSFDTQRPRNRATIVTGAFFLLLSAVGITIHSPKVRRTSPAEICCPKLCAFAACERCMLPRAIIAGRIT